MNLSPSAFQFETERLLIRPLSQRDEEIYCFIYTDDEMMRFVGPPLSRERAQRSFAKAMALMDRQSIERLFLTVLDRATQRPLGICSIPKTDANRRAVEVGIMLRPEARAHRLGEEVLSSLIDRAFDALPIGEVWAEITAQHTVAARLLTRIGFSRASSDGPESGAPGQSGVPGQEVWSVSRQSWRRNLNQSTRRGQYPM